MYGLNYTKFWAFNQRKRTSLKRKKNIDVIFEGVSVADTVPQCWTIAFQTTIFQYSKIYGSPTRVTRFKVLPNMADPISIKDSRQKR